jgi:chaperonin GroES
MNDCEYRPTADRVVVEKEDAVLETNTGIILVNEEQGLKWAKVVAVGPGKTDGHGGTLPVEVNPGDRIGYHSNYGTDLKSSTGRDLMLLHEEDILFVEKADDVQSTTEDK